MAKHHPAPPPPPGGLQPKPFVRFRLTNNDAKNKVVKNSEYRLHTTGDGSNEPATDRMTVGKTDTAPQGAANTPPKNTLAIAAVVNDEVPAGIEGINDVMSVSVDVRMAGTRTPKRVLIPCNIDEGGTVGTFRFKFLHLTVVDSDTDGNGTVKLTAEARYWDDSDVDQPPPPGGTTLVPVVGSPFFAT